MIVEDSLSILRKIGVILVAFLIPRREGHMGFGRHWIMLGRYIVELVWEVVFKGGDDEILLSMLVLEGVEGFCLERAEFKIHDVARLG